MGGLRDQLLKAGLVSEDAVQKVETRKKRKEKKKKHQQVAAANPTQDLEICTTIQQFRAAAKRALLDDSVSIGTIIQLGHKFKGQLVDAKFRYFIQFFYRLRDELENVDQTNQKALIRQMYKAEFK